MISLDSVGYGNRQVSLVRSCFVGERVCDCVSDKREKVSIEQVISFLIGEEIEKEAAS